MVGKGVDNTVRKKWDKEEYERIAKQKEKKLDELEGETAKQAKARKHREQDPLHNGLILQRTNLQARDFDVDLSSRLGKFQQVSAGASAHNQAGYYCPLCDCSLKDSSTYLDHINGKKHQRLLGMSMRVEKSTVAQVKERFEMHKRKKSESTKYDFKDRVLQIEAAEEAERYERAERKRTKQNEVEEAACPGVDDGGMDPEMAAMMGFGSFGGSKKS